MRTLTIIFLLFVCQPSVLLGQQSSELFTLYTTYTPGDLPPAAVSFSDDFNRADAADLGTNWMVLAGSMAITNNRAIQLTEGYGKIAVGFVTNTATVSQYAKVTLEGGEALGSGIYPQILLRINGTNECYGVEAQPNEDLIKLYYYTNAAGGATLIASAAATIATNDTFSATVTGTGTSTIWRVWVNPTNLPSAADNWDGDTTPTASFTDDPAVAADTGKGTGLSAYASNLGFIKFDDFFGGDIP